MENEMSFDKYEGGDGHVDYSSSKECNNNHINTNVNAPSRQNDTSMLSMSLTSTTYQEPREQAVTMAGYAQSDNDNIVDVDDVQNISTTASQRTNKYISKREAKRAEKEAQQQHYSTQNSNQSSISVEPAHVVRATSREQPQVVAMATQRTNKYISKREAKRAEKEAQQQQQEQSSFSSYNQQSLENNNKVPENGNKANDGTVDSVDSKLLLSGYSSTAAKRMVKRAAKEAQQSRSQSPTPPTTTITSSSSSSSARLRPQERQTARQLKKEAQQLQLQSSMASSPSSTSTMPNSNQYRNINLNNQSTLNSYTKSHTISTINNDNGSPQEISLEDDNDEDDEEEGTMIGAVSVCQGVSEQRTKGHITNPLSPSAPPELVPPAIVEQTPEQEQQLDESQQIHEEEPNVSAGQSNKKKISAFALLIILIVLIVVIVILFVNNDNSTDGPINIPNMTDSTKYLVEQLEQIVISNGWSSIGNFNDDKSPQSLALQWLVENTSSNDNKSVDLYLYVLAVTYYALNGPDWTSHSGWFKDLNVCSWDYITCDENIDGNNNNNNTITKLEIPRIVNKLDATLPQELFLLSSLRHLAMPANRIIDIAAPPNMTNFPNLALLDLSLNSFGIEVPYWFYQLTMLETLNLGFCEFTGTISTEIGLLSSLHNLILYSNSFTGFFPSEVGLLASLRSLDIAGKINFEGKLPTEIARLTSLTSLTISEGSFTGTITDTIKELSQLERLAMGGSYAGNLDDLGLGNFSRLSYLQITDAPRWTGTIPTEVGLLTSLTSLLLGSTSIGGTLPSELGDLSMLKYWVLRRNSVSGSLFTEIGNLSNLELWSIALEGLTGTIPSEIGNLTNLATLRLDFDDSVELGLLPSEIGNMLNLEYLQLETKGASTIEVPTEICDLPKLNDLCVDTEQMTCSDAIGCVEERSILPPG